MNRRYFLVPSNSATAWKAIQLLGAAAVEVGTWTQPVYVTVRDEDLDVCRELLAIDGIELRK